MDRKRIASLALAALAALALAACGGDDLRGADEGAGDAAEQVDTVATPEQERVLREEAQRVEDVVDGAISDLREVRSLDDLERHATEAADELAEARARIEALELAEEQEAARTQLVGAVETLERQVRELQATIADGDPIGALERASELSLAEVRAAIEQIEREASQ